MFFRNRAIADYLQSYGYTESFDAFRRETGLVSFFFSTGCEWKALLMTLTL